MRHRCGIRRSIEVNGRSAQDVAASMIDQRAPLIRPLLVILPSTEMIRTEATWIEATR